MLTRRTVLQIGGTAAVAAGSGWAGMMPSRADGALPAFVDALPIPPVATPVGVTGRAPYPGAPLYRLAATPGLHQFHRDLPATPTWGYNGAFLGPTFKVRAGQPIYVQWLNQLGTRPHPLWAEDFARAHGPGIGGTLPSARRMVTHLHGSKTPADSDGWPEEIILHGQQSIPYFYPNRQEAATLWYHDHALGITRLNVYMGLAGFYLLSDPWEAALALPAGPYDVPLAILDRSFNADGSYSYPMVIAPEVFAQYLTVNGKITPFHKVDRGKYRLRLLNGCSAQFVTLRLSDGAAFAQIASEQGLLPRPVTRTWIRLAPGERAEIVVDFADHRNGDTVELVNVQARDVFPDGGLLPAPEPLLQFRVGFRPGHTTALPAVLRSIRALAAGLASRSESSQTVASLLGSRIAATRSLTLKELDVSQAPTGLCLTAEDFAPVIEDQNGKVLWDDALPFSPALNSVEVWNIANQTDDSHPVHIHLAQSQVLQRSNTPPGIEIGNAEGAGIWKDTVQIHPGETCRLALKFDYFRGRYPIHCHILDHEDCEMMRYFVVA